MRLTRAVLLIADISGYSDFITHREVSLLHAEQIITELLEAMIDRSEHPLVLNKFEGDAALLYAESGADPVAVVSDVLAQLRAMFAGFAVCRDRIRESRSNCSCDACAKISNLELKAFVHCGEIAIKKIRQFEELAGEEVILIHRLLKNQVPERDYVMLTEAVAAQWPVPADRARRHIEQFEGVGELALMLLPVSALPERPTSGS